jgi:hypothetical protein
MSKLQFLTVAADGDKFGLQGGYDGGIVKAVPPVQLAIVSGTTHWVAIHNPEKERTT